MGICDDVPVYIAAHLGKIRTTRIADKNERVCFVMRDRIPDLAASGEMHGDLQRSLSERLETSTAKAIQGKN